MKKTLILLSLLGLIAFEVTCRNLDSGSSDVGSSINDPNASGDSGDSEPIDSSDPDSASDGIEEIMIGIQKKIQFEIAQDKDGKPEIYKSGFYKFKFYQKLQNRDAFIMVKGREDFEHSPELFFSSLDTNPSYYSSNSEECGIMGVDICTIPHQYIEEDTYYYLGVYCYDDCEFQIKIIYNQIFEIKVGEIVSVAFSANSGAEAQEVQVWMGNDTSITNLLIEAYILNPSDIHDPFHLYVNQGNEAPSTLNHHYLAEQIWFQGQGVLISHKDTYPVWKYNTNYTILVEAPEGAIIAVAAEGWGDQRKIFLMKNIYDMVDYGDYRIYELTLNNVEIAQGDGISFDLEPFYGNPNIYVNPETLPDKKEGFKWSSRESTGMQSLTITNNDYNMQNMTSIQLYVMIYGEMTASYRLIAYRADVSVRYLVYDCTETGYVTGKDVVQYQLFTLNLKKTNITISATGLSGNIYLYVKVCAGQNSLDCAITNDEIQNKKSDELKFFVSEDAGSIHKIHFEHDPEECQQANINATVDGNSTVSSTQTTNCITIVALANALPTNSSKTVSHYKLTARHKNSHVVLQENEPYRSWLRQSDKDYFKFTIPDTSDAEQIEKVEFLATAIAGEIDVYVSRTNRYPRSNDTEKAGFLNEDSLTFVNPTDFLNGEVSLAGHYYVTISGYTSATYDLSVKVIRKNGTLAYGVERRLYMGYVDFGNLDYMYPETYYFQYDKQDELFPQIKDPLEPPQKINVFIYFHQFNKTSKQKAANLFFWPNFSMFYRDSVTKEEKPVEVADMFYSMDFFQFTILVQREDTGKYVMILNHTMPDYKDIRLKYFISVNHNNINNIVPEGGGYVSELFKNETDLFELFIPEESSFYLEIYQCVGRVNLSASSNLQNIQSAVYDLTTGQQLNLGGSQDNLMYWEDLKGGPFYFAISPESIEQNEILKKYQIFDGAIFMLIPHIIKNGVQTPHHYMFAGGKVDYDILTDKNYTVVVQVPRLACQDCETMPYNVSYYSYTVHVTDSLELIDYFSQCNLGKRNIKFEKSGFKNYTERVQRHFSTVFFDEKGPANQTVEFEISTRLIGKGPFYVSVMAVAYVNTKTKYENQDPYSFMYQKLIMKLDDNPFTDDDAEAPPVSVSDFLMLFIILGGAFVVIGIFIGIYCYQQQYGASIQEIEMEKQQQKVGDDDDQDVADQYKKGADKFKMMS